MNSLRNFILLSLFSISISQLAHCATIPVGPPPNSIQTAVDAASDGDTVLLSAGTYVAQQVVIINKSINLEGAGENVSIIQAPSATTHLADFFTYGGRNWYCIVIVDNQAAPTIQSVNISNLTVDGDTQQDTTIAPFYGDGNRFYGIGYHNANGTVSNVHVTNTRQNTNFDELAGGGMVNASDIGSVNFTVDTCLIDLYQRIGLDLRGAALNATINNNTINRGYVLTPGTTTATPLGIQFLSNKGTVTNNRVLSNIATVANSSSTAILLFGSANDVTLSGNTLTNNDTSIATVSSGNQTISNNSLDFTTTPGINPPVGIVVQDPLGATLVSANTMNLHTIADSINMNIIASANQLITLQNNSFLGADTGLLIDGAGSSGPTITMNSDTFTGTSGYYIQEVAAPNDIWPSSASVVYDGIVAGQATLAQFNFLLTKILDKNTDPALGLVIDYVVPPSNFVGTLVKNGYFNCIEFRLNAIFTPSTASDIISYEIFKNGILVATIPVSGPYIYSDVTCGRFSASNYVVVSIDSFGIKSAPIPLTIL